MIDGFRPKPARVATLATFRDAAGEPIDRDTQDVYVEQLNPSNPRQVEDGGRWVDIDVRKDVIAVRGRKVPVDFTRETTPHGVIVASDLERVFEYFPRLRERRRPDS